MKDSGKLKTTLALLVTACLLLCFSCMEEITTVETAQFTLQVVVEDTSFVTREIFGQNRVSGAEVNLTAVTTGLRFSGRTNRQGVARIPGVLPDYYHCEVRRVYPEDTVKAMLGLTGEQILVGSLSNLALTSPADSFRILLKLVPRPTIIISEIYYNGAPPPPPFYFHDQFLEIYNNSTGVVYLDGYAIGDGLYGYRDDLLYVHLEHLYQFPGDGDDYPLFPGETIIVAQDAINHTEFNAHSIDLSMAQFEYYNPLSNDVDNPDVPNMIQLHHEYGFDFLYSVMNDGLVLAKLEPDDTLRYDERGHILVPIERVADGVEYKDDLTNVHLKYFSDVIDAGLTGGMPPYQGKSVRRRVFKEVGGMVILMDNNNSSIDFEVIDAPTPLQVP